MAAQRKDIIVCKDSERPSLKAAMRQFTLTAIRRHPRPSNLRWVEIESLLVHLGAVVKEGKGSAVSVTLKGGTAYFHRPHPDDKADKGAIATALKLLDEVGLDRQREPGRTIHVTRSKSVMRYKGYIG